MSEGYTVLVISMAHYDAAEDYAVGPFPTYELAKEFARRRARDSAEELRGAHLSPAELCKLRHVFGEDASVVRGEPHYAGSQELDFFIGHPATAEERDWQAFKRLAGVR